jgi:hypothetical protein
MYVRRLTTLFGENAGKIWSALNQEGCIKKDKLLEITKLDEKNFFAGVGWLAREDKITKEDEDCFKLGNSNLETRIGSHAGLVWKILDIWGDAEYRTIKRLSNLDDSDLQSALGWLAREDKIVFNENQKFLLK